ncbi:MAG TPA: hypothetical protein VJ783_18020 [Pirellulales bacterium]|nr:hypothetical protein [Pirellulales bacterium]
MEAGPLWALRAVLCLAAATAADKSPTAEKLEPEFTRKTAFALVFSEPRHGTDAPREVHLHVSTDRGKTWDRYAQSPPGKGRFAFKAPGDGEYWFMLRTKFASGRYLPDGRPVPEQKVIVDTVPPTLALDVCEGEGGEVHLRWQVSDPNLDADTFQLEYKSTDLASTWQRVALDRAAIQPGQTEYSGETTIVPSSDGVERSLIVRADIADKAKNHTAREQPLRLSLARAANNDDGQTDEDAPPEMKPAFGHPSATAASHGEDRSYPVLDSSQGPLGRERPPVGSEADAEPQGPAIGPPNRQPFVTETVHPPVTRENESFADPDATQPTDAEFHPRMSNKKQLELDYDIDGVGSAKIAKVDLWYTRDGGQTWNVLAADDDCLSPMRVNVEGEGLYGFRVVATTASGLRGPTPASGEPPDVWVGVDLTPPEARLVSAELEANGDAEKMVITWEAADDRLAARPVALRYSENPSGPWTTIAAGLENTGLYAWRLDERLPERIYLQLEVRDEAGNVSVGELPDAVETRPARPRSRVRDVHPAAATPPRMRRAMSRGQRTPQ